MKTKFLLTIGIRFIKYSIILFWTSIWKWSHWL